MRRTRTVEYNGCDFCDKDTAAMCSLCAKDFCKEHGIGVITPPGRAFFDIGTTTAITFGDGDADARAQWFCFNCVQIKEAVKQAKMRQRVGL